MSYREKEFALARKLKRNLQQSSAPGCTIVEGGDNHMWLKVSEGALKKALVKISQMEAEGRPQSEMVILGGQYFGPYSISLMSICVEADADVGFVGHIVRRCSDLKTQINIYTVASAEDPFLVSDPAGVFSSDATLVRSIRVDVDNIGVGV